MYAWCSILPEGLQASRQGPGGSSAQAAAVSEVSSSEAFQEQCPDTAGICIIAALDPSSPDFETHKSTLQVSALLERGLKLVRGWQELQQALAPHAAAHLLPAQFLALTGHAEE